MADSNPQAAAGSGGAASSEGSGGSKTKLRCLYPTDTFKLDDKTVVTGEFKEFSATDTKKIMDAAKAQDVKLISDPPPKKGS